MTEHQANRKWPAEVQSLQYIIHIFQTEIMMVVGWIMSLKVSWYANTIKKQLLKQTNTKFPPPQKKLSVVQWNNGYFLSWKGFH